MKKVEGIINLSHKELNLFVLHASCLNINSFAYPFKKEELKNLLIKNDDSVCN
jgi:hypothetical protein